MSEMMFMIDIEASPLKIDCWVKVHLLLFIIVSFIPSLYYTTTTTIIIIYNNNDDTMGDYFFSLRCKLSQVKKGS